MTRVGICLDLTCCYAFAFLFVVSLPERAAVLIQIKLFLIKRVSTAFFDAQSFF